ncbi:GGDEF domain-containing response regulator [Pseudobdellovibrio exovorus]|uniref:diguanylate cyclase n=1 Tax=Pseudobdellovibrio exovorus JSS TaxID=1184267 RepID=M4V9W5_9BACT|nr:diguanylate cyclase [Pseudobdellovibrio exovorus]AGH96192.1 sensor histidine kinase [Pseudobdellovibrio exovorus JSS]
MNIREVAPEFGVFVFSQDADLGSRLKFALGMAKYDVHFFSDFEEMFQRVQSAAPHVIVLDQAALVTPLSEVFQKVLESSSEIRMLCLAESEVLSQLNDYRDYNMVQYFNRAEGVVVDQVCMSVDQTCETLYRLYQNEQLFNTYKGTAGELAYLQEENEKQKMGPQARPFQTRIAEYRAAESKEELVQMFFRQTASQSWAFLKYVSSIQTYISVSSQNMPDEWVEGLSYKIPSSQSDFNDKILLGEYPESFLQYIKAKWGVDTLKVMPLLLKNEIEGLLITPQDISAEVAEDFSLMSLVYNLITLEAQPQNLDVEDPLTGFYNQLFYKRILDKEIDRSKRTFAPISVVKVAIDIFREIEVSHGKAFCDEIIKKVADVIKQTSRLPDYICRTAENEFSLVLINCNRKGAALRADRLRQRLKGESFSKAGFVVTVSQGISEYPSLTKTAESLNDSARKALDFIITKGGDKICIYKAPKDHQPDFQVNT